MENCWVHIADALPVGLSSGRQRFAMQLAFALAERQGEGVVLRDVLLIAWVRVGRGQVLAAISGSSSEVLDFCTGQTVKGLHLKHLGGPFLSLVMVFQDQGCYGCGDHVAVGDGVCWLGKHRATVDVIKANLKTSALGVINDLYGHGRHHGLTTLHVADISLSATDAGGKSSLSDAKSLTNSLNRVHGAK